MRVQCSEGRQDYEHCTVDQVIRSGWFLRGREAAPDFGHINHLNADIMVWGRNGLGSLFFYAESRLRAGGHPLGGSFVNGDDPLAL